jgi:hypothetical protein
MASISKGVEGKEVLNVQLVNNEVKQPIFKAILHISYKQDPFGVLSMIPLKVLMVQDVMKCYNGKIGSIGYMEIRQAYDKFFENGVLREEFKNVEKKGLTCSLHFLNVFKIEWIRIVLRRIHDSSLWLDNGPIKITKRIIHRVIGHPTIDQPKTMRRNSISNWNTM